MVSIQEQSSIESRRSPLLDRWVSVFVDGGSREGQRDELKSKGEVANRKMHEPSGPLYNSRSQKARYGFGTGSGSMGLGMRKVRNAAIYRRNEITEMRRVGRREGEALRGMEREKRVRGVERGGGKRNIMSDLCPRGTLYFSNATLLELLAEAANDTSFQDEGSFHGGGRGRSESVKVWHRLDNGSTIFCAPLSEIRGLPKEPFSLPLYQQVLWSSLFGAMLTVAIAGNALVMWTVLAHPRMKTVTNYFIVNLSVADMMLSVLNCAFNFSFMMHRKRLVSLRQVTRPQRRDEAIQEDSFLLTRIFSLRDGADDDDEV
ncbi:unnamed protein product [Darwinula stevensoni]|uniref:G-protein coupled receptors family 1 profile domain-containing protein n=1 Tax=Darwinula stevensoni TaxID=69355 RepID=A0A7R8WXM4_9CRUS|nr:unnamed protein product [Darwinula stevensoni]CAG0878538.1 unnamed protein product [Darwinula stevensoni]